MIFDLSDEKQKQAFNEIMRRREKALSVYRQFPDEALIQMIMLAAEVLMERRMAEAMDKLERHDRMEKGRYA